MKIALAILCGLMFLAGQMAGLAAPAAGAARPVSHCGCGGRMPCCAARPASLPQMPVATAVPSGSQLQIASCVPAAVTWLSTPVLKSPIAPAGSVSLAPDAAPLFARHCAWLI